jgi:hypothetical protein
MHWRDRDYLSRHAGWRDQTGYALQIKPIRVKLKILLKKVKHKKFLRSTEDGKQLSTEDSQAAATQHKYTNPPSITMGV